MRSLRSRVSLLVLLALTLQGTTCAPSPLEALLPASGDVVTSLSFPVQVTLGAGTADPSTLEATLNGVALPLSGGPTVFSATMSPGAPLRVENELRASVLDANGVRFERNASFTYAPPRARARRINSSDQVIDALQQGKARPDRARGRGPRVTGPLAHGRRGDWLLENGVVRFVVQDAPKRDHYSIGQFGGNVIDAELVGRPGRDQFFEFQPAVNIETVVNAEFVEIVNDGTDGTAAIVRSCGPDDLLDYVNASSQVGELGVTLPNGTDDTDVPVYACTSYRLEPGADHLLVTTTIENLSDAPLGLFVGDYVNGMGQLEQWTPPAQGVGELLLGAVADAQAYFGFRAAEGVDYALVPVPVPGVAPPFDRSSSFTDSGITFVMHSHLIALVLGSGANATPTFVVPANGSRSFERRFAVGDGSPSRAVELVAEVAGLATGALSGCVTVGGAPAPGVRVAVGPVSLGSIKPLTSLFVTDANGCYAGRLPVGTYGASAARLQTPFEGGAASPPIHSITIRSDVPVLQDFALPATGRLRVRVRDEGGRPLPARVTVVGDDASPEPALLDFPAPGFSVRSALFRDVTKDPLPFGVLTMAYVGADGVLELDVEPGTWLVAVSRGTEYSLFSAPFEAVAGETTVVDARIARVLQTPGFVSSDYHVHMLPSFDSNIGLVDRVLSFAGEGVENLIATDHAARTDVTPVVRELGLTPFLAGTVGEEITTDDYGHFNAYPLGVDPTRPSRGATDWGGAAPIGEDFPSLGNFVLSPAEIEADVLASPLNAGLETVVQVNHINSHFDPLRIDTSVEPPRSFKTDPLSFRLDPSIENFFHPFPALELWNGATVGAQNEFLLERIGIWMNLLNQGLPTTAVADTDTHTFFDLRTAGARSWSASSTDDPAALDPDEVGLAVKQGRLVGGQGPYVQTRLTAASTGATASLALGAPTLATTSDGAVTLGITVQSPLWAPYDTIEVYANAETTVAQRRDGVATLFGALPSRTLRLADGDFVVDEVDVAEASVPGASRLETRLDVQLTDLTRDTWVVVVVKGTPGQSPPMFPVFPRNLSRDANPTQADLLENTVSEPGVRALAFTNALYVDVDGNGRFDAPGVRVAPGS